MPQWHLKQQSSRFVKSLQKINEHLQMPWLNISHWYIRQCVIGNVLQSWMFCGTQLGSTTKEEAVQNPCLLFEVVYLQNLLAFLVHFSKHSTKQPHLPRPSLQRHGQSLRIQLTNLWHGQAESQAKIQYAHESMLTKYLRRYWPGSFWGSSVLTTGLRGHPLAGSALLQKAVFQSKSTAALQREYASEL